MHLIILHKRLIFQRICILIGFSPKLLVLWDLGQLDAIVIRRGANANHDKAEKYDADRYDSR